MDEARLDSYYEMAKMGRWKGVLDALREEKLESRMMSRYARKTSGWTMLHQAAYWGDEDAVRALIINGASPFTKTNDKQTPADVAEAHNHTQVSSLLRQAMDTHSNWHPSPDPNTWPASSKWDQAEKKRANQPMVVSYAGGRVHIPKGSSYFADSFGRVLIGWHGTYSPPCGMGGESMVNLRE